MTKEDRQRAEQIIKDFPMWVRPMSTEEFDLVEKFREIQLNEVLSESNRYSMAQMVDEEL